MVDLVMNQIGERLPSAEMENQPFEAVAQNYCFEIVQLPEM
jgi:hypothetical protein